MRITSLLPCLIPSLLLAQAPQAFDFQGVARDGSGAVLGDQPVGLLISIVTDNPNGTVVYRESHAASTSPFGLFTIAVGQGTPLLGTLAGVVWANGAKYIRVGMDPNGGNAYQDLGTTQLLSVPYALHAGSGSGGGSLDGAYDFGGPGQGRTINADAGAVQINNAGTNPTGLQVTSAVASSTAIRAEHTGTGVGVRAASLNPSNPFAAVQATTNSADANNSAIIGNNDGAGYGVSGQIPATATGSAAVYGSNLRTNGGSGVTGIGFNGVVGQAQSAQGYGLYGVNTNPANGTTTLGIGTYGLGFNGVYGQTTSVTQGWAGYFTADVGVDGAGYALGGWINASDARLKRDVRPIEGALEKVRLLEGRRYVLDTPARDEEGTIIRKSRPQFGLMAQDLEHLFPEMVSEKALLINMGDDTMYKTVDYIQLVPVLIEAIKELSGQVEELRRELDSLR